MSIDSTDTPLCGVCGRPGTSWHQKTYAWEQDGVLHYERFGPPTIRCDACSHCLCDRLWMAGHLMSAAECEVTE